MRAKLAPACANVSCRVLEFRGTRWSAAYPRNNSLTQTQGISHSSRWIWRSRKELFDRYVVLYKILYAFTSLSKTLRSPQRSLSKASS